jgi:phosphate starvation-inducible PhoH-like protein
MDEAQNSTVSTMKMVLTRICDGTKVVVTGDNAQSDRKDAHNGLLHLKSLINTYGESEHIATVDFGFRDVQRHPVVSEILKLYGED